MYVCVCIFCFIIIIIIFIIFFTDRADRTTSHVDDNFIFQGSFLQDLESGYGSVNFWIQFCIPLSDYFSQLFLLTLPTCI